VEGQMMAAFKTTAVNRATTSTNLNRREQKMKIDQERIKNDPEYWDEVAPLGAQHYVPECNSFYEGWYFDHDGITFFRHHGHEDNWEENCDVLPDHAIPRPPPIWNGQGLPQAGCFVEYFDNAAFADNEETSGWTDGDKLEVICIKDGPDSREVALVWNERDKTGTSLAIECMRPIKSPKQCLVDEIATQLSRHPEDAPLKAVAQELIDKFDIKPRQEQCK
jgi:hypothetical protein